MSPWQRVAVTALMAACATSNAGTPPPVGEPAPASPNPTAGVPTPTPTPAQPQPEPPTLPPVSPRPPGSPAPAPPPEHHKHPDLVRYGPSATRYIISRHFRVEQSFGGQPEVQDLGARLFVTVAISGPADAGRYPATITVDSIVPDSGTPEPLGGMLTKVRSLVYAGRLAPVGEFDGAPASDTTAITNLTQFVPNFRDFLPRIPASGVKPGASWTDTLVLVQRAGGGSPMSRRAIIRSNATGWEDRGGAQALRIETMTTYDVSGGGQNSGQSFQVAGTGAGSARVFLGEDGRFMGGEARDSAKLTVTLPTQGLTIPTIQVVTSTVSTRP